MKPILTPRVPRSHLSVRVPWHDAGWDGTICRAPRLNSSCLALNRIGASKNDDVEEPYAGQFLDTVPRDDVPPCFSERVSFLSAKPQHRLARHAYTALTRQSRRLVILCQGDPHRLVDFRHVSEATRRLTNLFEPPRPVKIGTQTFDGKHIHRSRRGELMISKSEVLIANELQTAGIEYAYERPLVVTDGSRRYPDFTIEDAETGNTWYWEHLGMKGDAEYDRKWGLKLQWYRNNGILPEEAGGGPNGILITTEEVGGIQTDQIAAIVARIKNGE